MPDYYKVLGIERTANHDAVKRAYRRLALRFHPDQNQGSAAAEEQFKQIVEAYRVLGEPTRRRFYDRFGIQREALTHVDSPFARGGFEDLVENVLDELLRRPKIKPVPGKDRRYELSVSFCEAALGTEQRIDVPMSATCGGCAGSGAAHGTRPERCHVCEGRGEVRETGPLLPFRKVCLFCSGRGVVVAEPCLRCSGSGIEDVSQVLTIRVPEGAEDGLRLRYRGAGEPGQHGGPDGDLYVVVRVKEDPLFSRRDFDVTVKVPLTVPEAMLGATVDVPMLDGVIRLSIPPGTQPGRQFRLRQRGIPKPGSGGRGDAYVEVTVELPEVDAALRDALALWPSAASLRHPRRVSYERSIAGLRGGGETKEEAE